MIRWNAQVITCIALMLSGEAAFAGTCLTADLMSLPASGSHLPMAWIGLDAQVLPRAITRAWIS